MIPSCEPAPLVRRVVDGLLAVVLAPPCGACGVPLATPTAGPVCETCWLAIRPYTPPVCPECGAPVASWRTLDSRADCKRLPPRIVSARSLGEYDGALRDITHVLKYGRRRSLGPRLAALMRQRGADVLEGADAAVPVPLHRTRRRRRGFNQAADLARCLGLPVLDALRRSRPTHVQTSVAANRRRANVRGAFELAWPARASELEGRTLVLVDDVWTTGATLEACARVLARAGAGELRAITTARVTLRQRR